MRCSRIAVSTVLLAILLALPTTSRGAAPPRPCVRPPEYPYHLDALKHSELGDVMNALLNRCLFAYCHARKELQALLADPAMKPKKWPDGLWDAIKEKGNTCWSIHFPGPNGPICQVSKMVYVDIKRAKQGLPGGTQEVPGAGYDMRYNPPGKLKWFSRRTHGELMEFDANRRVRSFSVRLSKKSSYEAEWDAKGKLIREGIFSDE